MSILEKQVVVGGLANQMQYYYENLGYDIPRYVNENGRLTVKKDTTILVNVDDLPPNSAIKVTKICDKCNEYLKDTRYVDLVKSRKKHDQDLCPKCIQTKMNVLQRINPPYEKSIEYQAKKHNKEYLLDEYSSKNQYSPRQVYRYSKFVSWWDCPKCHETYDMLASERFRHDVHCPYCSGRRVNDSNCIKTTHPHIASLLVDQTLGKKLTRASNQIIELLCPECNHITSRQVFYVTSRGFRCPMCHDGYKYPEKFMFSLLKQLNIDFDFQKKFKWSQGKYYDFFIPSLNTVIETHGGQHYKDGFRSIEEEQENDRFKKETAKLNGIDLYIIINCSKSEMSFIKENIKESELSSIFDLSKIDWELCQTEAVNSLVKRTSELWNDGIKSTKEIGRILKISKSVAWKYLKQAAELKWCDYTPEKGMEAAFRPVMQFNLKGELLKEWRSLKEVENTIGVNVGRISMACNPNTVNTIVDGFLWQYKDDYLNNIPLKELGEHNYRSLHKPVVQLDLEFNYITEYTSLSEASKKSGVYRDGIRKCCNKDIETASNFRWMYKEEYDKLFDKNSDIKIEKELVANF